MLAVNPNPREYDNARFVRYSTTSWVPPAPSARINTLAPDPARGGKRQLCQRFGDDADVVGGGVTAGVARTQRQGQRFPGACVAVVDERAERMMPEALLIRRGCVFFLRVRGHQRGIEVDDQRILSADVVVGGAGTGMGPRDLAGGGAGGVDCP